MNGLLLWVLLASAAQITAPAPQSEAGREIARLTEEYEDGIRRRDATVHERLFAEDYTYTPGNGNFMKRADHMAFTKSGVTAVSALITEDRLIRVYGDTAVVTGRWVFTGSRGDQAATAQRIRFLLVWAKRGGRWQIVAEQRTVAREVLPGQRFE